MPVLNPQAERRPWPRHRPPGRDPLEISQESLKVGHEPAEDAAGVSRQPGRISRAGRCVVEHPSGPKGARDGGHQPRSTLTLLQRPPDPAVLHLVDPRQKHDAGDHGHFHCDPVGATTGLSGASSRRAKNWPSGSWGPACRRTASPAHPRTTLGSAPRRRWSDSARVGGIWRTVPSPGSALQAASSTSASRTVHRSGGLSGPGVALGAIAPG